MNTAMTTRHTGCIDQTDRSTTLMLTPNMRQCNGIASRFKPQANQQKKVLGIANTPSTLLGRSISSNESGYEQEADRIADKVMKGRRDDAFFQDAGEARAQRKKGSSTHEKIATGRPNPRHPSLSLGRRMDQNTREFMESRIGYDFGEVRIHDYPIASSLASGIHADAFTLGNDIVFGSGRYQPEKWSGKHLLAHELAHVVQQKKSPNAVNLIHRRLMVEQPAENIPNPDGNGLVQTNAQTIEGYLRQLSPSGNFSVDRSNGEVSADTGFCPGALGGFLQGARSGYGIGHMIGSVGGNVPVLGEIFGVIGAGIGALVGGIGGLFGASVSAASESSTSTSSTCVCDFISTGNQWKIRINDNETPATLNDNVVQVQSPNSSMVWGAAGTNGQLQNSEQWLVLGHELCGHAWLEEQGQSEGDINDQAPDVFDPDFGLPEPDAERISGDQYLRHGPNIIERENMIRREHGLPERGFRIRDPYCGESFSRPRDNQSAQPQWQRAGNGMRFDTYMETCQYLRGRMLGSRANRYRIDQAIPESEGQDGGRHDFE